jgi:hypothetical protein
MSLPISTNTTCDIFRAAVLPPGGSPAVTAVPCALQCDWRGGQEAGDRNNGACTWTHIMLVPMSVDIRDGYVGISSQAAQDTVFIPDHTGTRFNVIFIERVQRGTPNEHKRVYLDRQAPVWPSDQL